MIRRQFMKSLAASPTALLLLENKQEEFVWKPPTKMIIKAKCLVKAEQLLPKDRLYVRDDEGEEDWIIFPEGRWQLVECKWIRVALA